MSEPVLIADLGGTNLRFAIARDGQVTRERTLRAEDHTDLPQAASIYLADIGERPRSGIFTAPGPSDGQEIVFTNRRNWNITLDAFGAAIGFEDLRVINDFAALAYGVPHLQAGDLTPLGEARVDPSQVMAVIGPGTGLGVAIVLPAGDGWQVISSEGGHAALAAQNENEERVIRYMRGLYQHCSAERALSGRGLSDLHDAVLELHGQPPRPLKPEQVTANAEESHYCREAVNLFTDFLATAAGDLALTAGAKGGVFIGGGIVPSLLPDLFDGARFRRRFCAKGRLRPYLEAIATPVITHDNPALLGLARFAEHLSVDRA